MNMCICPLGWFSKNLFNYLLIFIYKYVFIPSLLFLALQKMLTIIQCKS